MLEKSNKKDNKSGRSQRTYARIGDILRIGGRIALFLIAIAGPTVIGRIFGNRDNNQR